MKLTINEIHKMVSECVNNLLTEAISTDDAYNTYYKDKIPYPIWGLLMNGTKNMTPFHRKMADIIVRMIKEYGVGWKITDTAKMAQACWNKGVKAQQLLTNMANENYLPVNNFQMLTNILTQIESNEMHTEKEFLANGLCKIYEDDRILVTTTLSYTASRKYYGDSHWCTASGIDGRWDGFTMFKRYSEDGLLVQFVDKANRRNSFQTVATGGGSYSLTCDFYDKEKKFDDVLDSLHISEEKLNAINNTIDESWSEFKSLMNKFINNEQQYYYFAVHVYLKNNVPKLQKKMNSPETKSKLIEELNAHYSFEGGVPDDTESFTNYETYYSREVDEGRLVGINSRIRYDYYDYDTGMENEELKAKSYFTEKETNLMLRSKSYGVGRYAVILFIPTESSRRLELISCVPGTFTDSTYSTKGDILWFFTGENEIGFINSENGEVVLRLPCDVKNGSLKKARAYRFNGLDILGTSDDFVFFEAVNTPDGERYKVVAIVDTKGGKFKKFDSQDLWKSGWDGYYRA